MKCLIKALSRMFCKKKRKVTEEERVVATPLRDAAEDFDEALSLDPTEVKIAFILNDLACIGTTHYGEEIYMERDSAEFGPALLHAYDFIVRSDSLSRLTSETGYALSSVKTYMSNFRRGQGTMPPKRLVALIAETAMYCAGKKSDDSLPKIDFKQKYFMEVYLPIIRWLYSREIDSFTYAMDELDKTNRRMRDCAGFAPFK